MADALASRVAVRPSPPTGSVSENAEVRGIITGQTVIVLGNGDVICGRLTPKSVKMRTNEVDPADGSPVYDVEWQIEMGKVLS